MDNTKTLPQSFSYAAYPSVAGNSPQYQQYQPLQQFATTGPAAQDSAYQQPTAASYAQNLQQFQQAQGQNAQQQYAQQLNAYYAQQQQQQQQQQHQHQQMYAQQQQHQLLKQLYSNSPTASPTTSSSEQPGSNHLFTAEQYASFMNAQHQKQQQQHQIYDDHKFYTPVTGGASESITYNNTPQPVHTNRTRTGPRNGLQYSSADKVSHVKYQSGNLAYDF